jgi:hypothetical protein
MNARTLAGVLIRFWGILLIVSSLASVGVVLTLFVPVGTPNVGFRANTASFLIHIVVSFVAGIVFLRRGDAIADLIVDDEEPAGPPLTILNANALAMAILGMYFIITGVADAAGFAVAMREQGQAYRQSSFLFSQLAPSVVKTIAGILLLLGRHRIASMWSKVRAYKNIDEAEHAADD